MLKFRINTIYNVILEDDVFCGPSMVSQMYIIQDQKLQGKRI